MLAYSKFAFWAFWLVLVGWQEFLLKDRNPLKQYFQRNLNPKRNQDDKSSLEDSATVWISLPVIATYMPPRGEFNNSSDSIKNSVCDEFLQRAFARLLNCRIQQTNFSYNFRSVAEIVGFISEK